MDFSKFLSKPIRVDDFIDEIKTGRITRVEPGVGYEVCKGDQIEWRIWEKQKEGGGVETIYYAVVDHNGVRVVFPRKVIFRVLYEMIDKRLDCVRFHPDKETRKGKYGEFQKWIVRFDE